VFVVQMFGAPAVKRPIATVVTSPVLGENAEETIGGDVGGESIETISEESPEVSPLSVIHEDDMFIAVSNPDFAEAPTAYPYEEQSNFFERLLASPHTSLYYVYGIIGIVLALAVILFVFLEFHIQKPTHVFLALFLIIFMAVLLLFSDKKVLLAELQAFASFLPQS